jgi:hypothetical protein
MSNKGSQPHQNVTLNIVQSEDMMTDDDMPAANQQKNRNILKRTKESDDSFEFEHRQSQSQQRPSNFPTTYFNSSAVRQSTANAARRTPQSANNYVSRPSFPPFRLSFKDGQTPSELSIIKDINRQYQISLSFGRYSAFGKKKSFLLYANSSEQFDRLLNRSTWPPKICNLDYDLDSPSKIPTSYSVVVLNVPAQWSIEDFENDIKKQYQTIVKVERLYVRGGKPISKVRIDFSSNKELAIIIKNKRMVLDDANTSFPIEPYTPPIRILRCYNCQQYNDHTALNCPNKDKPVCFKCGQNHLYDPNCQNKICCAHCHQEHMAGNPNCPRKIEERNKRSAEMKAKSDRQQQRPTNPNPLSSVWNIQPDEQLAVTLSPKTNALAPNENEYMTSMIEISKKLDALMLKIDDISAEQSIASKKFEKLNQNVYSCRKELDSIKDLVLNTISPYLFELGETILGKNKQVDKEKLRLLHAKFKASLEEQTKAIIVNPQSNIHSNCSTPNE